MAITEQELTLLSSYMDGQLTERERASLEARLAADANLRAELDSLRATVGLLKQAERLRVPRSFTLDPKAYGKPARPSLWNQLGWSALTPLAGAASAIAVVMICAGGLVLSTSSITPQMAAAPQSQLVGGAQEEASQQPFAAGAAPSTETVLAEAAPTEAPTETAMIAAEPSPEASGEAAGSAPASGAGGGLAPAPTPAAVAPIVPPSPSDNTRSGNDAATANSAFGQPTYQAGYVPSTPKMGSEADAGAAADQQAERFAAQHLPPSIPPELVGGGLIVVGLLTLAIVVVTRRK